MLGVIHREVERGEILAPARNGAGGRPEGQNLGAIVAPCGELPSFVLLIRDSVVSPLGNPRVIHSPCAHLLHRGVAPGLWITLYQRNSRRTSRYIAGNMQVKTLRRRYSSSRNP